MVVGRGAREVVDVCVRMGEVAVSVMFACFPRVCGLDSDDYEILKCEQVSH